MIDGTLVASIVSELCVGGRSYVSPKHVADALGVTRTEASVALNDARERGLVSRTMVYGALYYYPRKQRDGRSR